MGNRAVRIHFDDGDFDMQEMQTLSEDGITHLNKAIQCNSVVPRCMYSKPNCGPVAIPFVIALALFAFDDLVLGEEFMTREELLRQFRELSDEELNWLNEKRMASATWSIADSMLANAPPALFHILLERHFDFSKTAVIRVENCCFGPTARLITLLTKTNIKLDRDPWFSPMCRKALKAVTIIHCFGAEVLGYGVLHFIYDKVS